MPTALEPSMDGMAAALIVSLSPAQPVSSPPFVLPPVRLIIELTEVKLLRYSEMGSTEFQGSKEMVYKLHSVLVLQNSIENHDAIIPEE